MPDGQGMTGPIGDPPPKRITPKWGFIAGLTGLVFFGFFAYLGDPGRGRAAAIIVGGMIIITRLRWDLKDRIWFWVTLGILIVVHVPLVLLVPWSSKSYPATMLLPVALFDYVFSYMCIKFIEKVMKRN